MKKIREKVQQALDDAERFRFWFGQGDIGPLDFWRELIDENMKQQARPEIKARIPANDQETRELLKASIARASRPMTLADHEKYQKAIKSLQGILE